jgi:hypothetical protein
MSLAIRGVMCGVSLLLLPRRRGIVLQEWQHNVSEVLKD